MRGSCFRQDNPDCRGIRILVTRVKITIMRTIVYAKSLCVLICCTRLFMTAQEGYMQGRRDTAARLLGQTAGRFHRNCKGDDRWTNRTEKNTYKKRKDKRHKEHGLRLHQRIFAFLRRGLHNMLWKQIRQAKRCTGNAKTTKEIYVCRCAHLRLWFCGAESTRTTSHTKKAGISAPRYSFSNGTGKRLAS